MKYYQEIEQKYEKALYENDKETLSYFAKFGKDKHHAIYNACQYEANIECGFTAPFKQINGWIQNEKIETEILPIFEGRTYANIKVGQLPNKRWVAESCVSLELSGYSSPVSVFSQSYLTREEAILKQLGRIREYIQHYAKDPTPYLKSVNAFWHKLYAEQIGLF